MRFSNSICIGTFLLVAVTGLGQNGSMYDNRIAGPSPKAPVGRYTPEQYQLEVIKHILSSPVLSSADQSGNGQLRRMGDRTAVYINQILRERGVPLTTAEQYRVVDMLQLSFGSPASVTPPGRQTKEALALLGQIEAPTQDFSLRLRIVEARKVIDAVSFVTK
jgi:hypothetical protein